MTNNSAVTYMDLVRLQLKSSCILISVRCCHGQICSFKMSLCV